MRVGIVGSAGSGKSTLAQNLAAALKVPVIEDKVLGLLMDQKGAPSWRGLRDTRIRRNIRIEALRAKVKAENEADAWVSDKTAVDYLAYWLQNQMEYETPGQTLSYIEEVKEQLPRYDVFVFLPVRDDVDYLEGRSTDPVHNFKVGAFKRGLLQLLGCKVVDAPYTFGEDIKAWIKTHLKGGAGKPAKKKATKKTAKKKGAKKKAAPKKAAKKKATKKKKKSTRKK
jgi:energy-coupling factor transporter ATP-binding protein EcfA2